MLVFFRELLNDLMLQWDLIQIDVPIYYAL